MSAPASVTVRVPATSANLGPGFDTLGLALRLYNRVRVTRTTGRGVTLASAVAPDARAGAEAMVTEAAAAFFRRARMTRAARFGAAVHLSGDVPVARGLGSSVTVRLGLVAGLNALAGGPLDAAALLAVVTALEHHPDNAAPALHGGFTAAGMVGGAVRCVRFRVPAAWRFVTLIPRFEVGTEAARLLVPDSFSKADTVHSLNRAALITGAFARGDAAALRGLFDDRLHQPHREALIPQLTSVIRAGERAGAVGGWLSGSGSTIMCLTVADAAAAAAAMLGALPDADVRVLAADNRGLVVR
jgi:homoserine kinase